VDLVQLEKIKDMTEKFDFNDILIKPATTSRVESRQDINPFKDGFLPLITAPMDTVVGESNNKLFTILNIRTCLPRGEENQYGFTSFSLAEIETEYKFDTLNPNGMYLIDIANGHMEKLLTMTKKIKKRYPNLLLMVGNVANPKTYGELSNAGADFIRVGIGNGGGCSTTVHTGVGYPMGSLVRECYLLSCQLDNPAKIVADGGMQNYSDIIKALALGADYVMVGSLFNKALESCGPNYLFKHIRLPQGIAEIAYRLKLPVYKKFRGMSTKEVQKKWGKKVLTTSEGVTRYRKVEYTLFQWIQNFEDYLRSSMSYSDATNLDEFIGNADIIKITDNAYNRFKK
jgi:IMP dehydrogenase/GMP reductase